MGDAEERDAREFLTEAVVEVLSEAGLFTFGDLGEFGLKGAAPAHFGAEIFESGDELAGAFGDAGFEFHVGALEDGFGLLELGDVVERADDAALTARALAELASAGEPAGLVGTVEYPGVMREWAAFGYDLFHGAPADIAILVMDAFETLFEFDLAGFGVAEDFGEFRAACDAVCLEVPFPSGDVCDGEGFSEFLVAGGESREELFALGHVGVGADGAHGRAVRGAFDDAPAVEDPAP